MDDAAHLRQRMRSDLTAAMKARDADSVRALRTTIAAIDNAEAVDAGSPTTAVASQHVAGAQSGVGAAEAARRELAASEVLSIIGDQIAEREAEAELYDSLGNSAGAQTLRREATALRGYVGQ